MTLRAPRPPNVPAPQRLPLLATLAPVVASVVLFLITRSPFTLAFAALGPVIAIASTADRAIQRRRTERRESQRFADAVEDARREIAAAHDEERLERDRLSPGAADLIDALAATPLRWRERTLASIQVRIGTASQPSDLRFDGVDRGGDEAEEIRSALASLATTASILPAAPVTVPIGTGIGITGEPVMAMALARAILIQLVARISPTSLTLEIPAGERWAWLRPLPNVVVVDDLVDTIRLHGDTDAVLALAPVSRKLQRGLDLAIVADATGLGSLSTGLDGVSLDLLGAAESGVAIAELAALAVSEEIAAALDRHPPESAGFAGLPQHGDPGLGATLGAKATGALVIDLAADGPHAVIGGTTGSGKSELLISWVLGMAASRSPEEVTFLFVDFKGGAAFDGLRQLPHCVGVMTDLDAAQSLRALVSLGAELRQRERLLAASGLRSIDDAADDLPFPRLVVLVDEYAALVETHSELGAVFNDLAARGRSLGVHLILCTQRPAGVVRDSILANCALRLSLRVASAADSTAVIGTDAASRLPARPVGRVLVSIAGGEPFVAQVAHSSPTDVEAVATRWASARPPRVPWCPPLPEVVELAAGQPDESIPFGLVDLPAEQRQEEARYDPERDGSLLVVGAARSGKSGLLRALALAPSLRNRVLVPTSVPALWDALTPPGAGPDAEPVLLLIDDLDATLAGCPEDHQAALLERLSRVLRDGPGRGIHCVLTAQRIGGALHSVTSLTSSLVSLRMSSRQEHLLVGGEASTFLGDAVPGAGYWRGNRIQVARAGGELPPSPPLARRWVPVSDVSGPAVTAVSTRPDELAARLGKLAPDRRVTVLGAWRAGEPAELSISVGGGPDILIAEPEVWQSQWTLFSARRRTGDVLFDGCSLAEIRALTRSRELPPPVDRGERPLWLLEADGQFWRAGLTS